MLDCMKYIKSAIIAAFIMAVASSCVNKSVNEAYNESLSSASKVEVVYFHGKQRCLSCRAIERFAKEVVDSGFSGNKAVIFKTVDITTPQGEQIADSYEIAGSALLIIKTEGGMESVEDMTAFAFRNARKNTPVFKRAIEDKVKEYLN